MMPPFERRSVRGRGWEFGVHRRARPRRRLVLEITVRRLQLGVRCSQFEVRGGVLCSYVV